MCANNRISIKKTENRPKIGEKEEEATLANWGTSMHESCTIIDIKGFWNKVRRKKNKRLYVCEL